MEDIYEEIKLISMTEEILDEYPLYGKSAHRRTHSPTSH